MQFVLSPRARADIEAIWDFTAARWDIEQAETYLRAIEAAMAVVAAKPERGMACDDIRAGYRRYPSGSHVIYYRRGATGIDIVRVLHQRMDAGRHL